MCLITNRQTLPKKNNHFLALIDLCQRAAQAGIDLIQIREKDLPTNQLCELTTAILQVTSQTNTRVLVNDRVDVALACQAHGVHLRSDSVPVTVARQLLGDDGIIGVSTHAITEIVAAAESGADFALFGPIYDTPSKRAYGQPLGLSALAQAAESTKMPVLALGGITQKNAAEIWQTRASGLAAIRLFSESTKLRELIDALKQ